MSLLSNTKNFYIKVVLEITYGTLFAYIFLLNLGKVLHDGDIVGFISPLPHWMDALSNSF